MSDKLFEKIVVKPSIDLIPDEYEIKDKVAVHVFTSSSQDDKDSAKLFLETLQGLDYEVDPEKNTHLLDSGNIDEFLESSKFDQFYDSKHCIILRLMVVF